MTDVYTVYREGKNDDRTSGPASITNLADRKKQEVLDFVEFLQTKRTIKRQRRNPIGLFADLKVEITAQELDEARQEMWHVDRA